MLKEGTILVSKFKNEIMMIKSVSKSKLHKKTDNMGYDLITIYPYPHIKRADVWFSLGYVEQETFKNLWEVVPV